MLGGINDLAAVVTSFALRKSASNFFYLFIVFEKKSAAKITIHSRFTALSALWLLCFESIKPAFVNCWYTETEEEILRFMFFWREKKILMSSIICYDLVFLFWKFILPSLFLFLEMNCKTQKNWFKLNRTF